MKNGIEWIEVAKLKPAKRNARTHTAKQIDQVARSIDSFGFNNPIIVDAEGIVIAGHCRLAAAKKLGMAAVPTIRVSGLSKSQIQAYAVADNQLALNAGWDYEILAETFSELIDLDFDATLTGFEHHEIDVILSDAAEACVATIPPEDDQPEPPADPIVRRGDLWTLGRHLLLCGDAKSSEDVARLMGGDSATMAFIDAPYNVPITGHVSGMGRVQHREFAEASGEMSSGQFVEFLTAAFVPLGTACANGAIIYTCMDWRHLAEIVAAGEAVFSEQKNLCVWSKTNAGMGTFYRSQHELVTVWKVGDAPHINNFGLGDKG